MIRPRFWCRKPWIAIKWRAQRFAHAASSALGCRDRRCRLRRSTFIFASNALATGRDECIRGACETLACRAAAIVPS